MGLSTPTDTRRGKWLLISTETMAPELKAAGAAEHLTLLSSVRRSPKWSFNSKPASPRMRQTPGPGDYQGNVHLNTISSKGHGNPNSGFGGTTPRELPKPVAPGPGAYSPSDPTHVSTKHGFGTSPRRDLKAKKTQNPGPGTYIHKEPMGCEGPQFTVTPRRQGPHRSNIPGPGSYEARSCAAKEAVPKYGFGTSPRSVRTRSTSPGPGAYDVNAKSRNASPKPTMGCRLEAPRVAMLPGPGDYCGAITTFGY